MAPLILFQGTADAVVSARSGGLVADQWLAYDATHSPGRRDPQRIVRSGSSREALLTVAGTPSPAGTPRAAGSSSSTGGARGRGAPRPAGPRAGSSTHTRGPP